MNNLLYTNNKYKKLVDLQRMTYQKVFWNSIILLLIESYIEISLSSYIAITHPIEESTFDNGGLLSGEVTSYYLAIAFATILFLFTVSTIVIIFLSKDLF